MDDFITIKVKGSNAALDALRAELEQLSEGDWFRPQDPSVELGAVLGDRVAPTVLEYRGSRLPRARAYVSWCDGEAEVQNIAPPHGDFSPSEYNQLADDLHDQLLAPRARVHSLEIERGRV